MCVHAGREHRTSPCFLCRNEAASQIGAMTADLMFPRPPCPDMPRLWEGDNS